MLWKEMNICYPLSLDCSNFNIFLHIPWKSGLIQSKRNIRDKIWKNFNQNFNIDLNLLTAFLCQNSCSVESMLPTDPD